MAAGKFAAMKRLLRESDPLEETLENPDLPPLKGVAAPGSSPMRRVVRVGLVIAGLAAVIVAVGIGLG